MLVSIAIDFSTVCIIIISVLSTAIISSRIAECFRNSRTHFRLRVEEAIPHAKTTIKTGWNFGPNSLGAAPEVFKRILKPAEAESDAPEFIIAVISIWPIIRSLAKRQLCQLQAKKQKLRQAIRVVIGAVIIIKTWFCPECT